MISKTFTVPNISCGHCTHTVEMEVGDLAGVKSVKAEIESKQVTVEWDAPATWDGIAALLQEINYPPGIRVAPKWMTPRRSTIRRKASFKSSRQVVR